MVAKNTTKANGSAKLKPAISAPDINIRVIIGPYNKLYIRAGAEVGESVIKAIQSFLRTFGIIKGAWNEALYIRIILDLLRSYDRAGRLVVEAGKLQLLSKEPPGKQNGQKQLPFSLH